MKLETFIGKINDNGYDAEYGTVLSKLFGESDTEYDTDGIKNREIEVFYLVRKSKNINAPYIIFFNGGPGIGFSQQFFEHDGYKDFLTEYNIVFMDQRGTGYSEKPMNDLNEYKYFTSRYISYDAEIIKNKIIGVENKWIVFGQSFGGHLVRKYLELYSNSALMGISHGYGECSPIIMKANIEKELFRQVGEYFEAYPNDQVILNGIKDSLDNNDQIGNEIRSLEGKSIMDVFSFYFGLYSYTKINEIISSFKGTNPKKCFLEEISFLGNLILKSGILNSVVAYVDLVDGLTDDEIYEMTENYLKSEKMSLDAEMFSTVRLSKNVISRDRQLNDLELFFNEKRYQSDPIDFELLCSNLCENNITLNVIGSRNDSLTPIQAIEAEQDLVGNYDVDNNYKFIFADGNHREWKENQNLIKTLLNSLKK